MSSCRFPSGFMWGAATAGHQVEGGNMNASLWPLEWSGTGMFKEPSGDACDSYHRYAEDIALLAGAGLSVYRFSVEWSRVEPERGVYSRAALEHYRRVCRACHDAGVEPFVTLNHFTVPRWHGREGGFNTPESVDWFAGFSVAVADHLGDLVTHVATFNEPNLGELLLATGVISDRPADPMRASGSPLAALGGALENVKASHVAARQVWRDGGASVGWTLAMPSFHGVDGVDGLVSEGRARAFDQFLDLSREDDYVGVQAYSRELFGPDGPIGPPKDAELMETGWEVYPAAAAESVRYAVGYAGVPAIVTENGIATSDDTQRIRYTEAALAELHAAIDDGVSLQGYIHWSLLDNWEWTKGFDMHFGLIEVDRSTFERRPKPSLARLGEIARRNSLQ